MNMGRRGRKRRLGIEDEYWALIAAGIGTVEACKLVGVGRKTGYRWRHERGGLPPLRKREDEVSDRYLSLLDRQRIASLRRQKLSMREIARRLGRSPSTISRELRRNSAGHDVGGYDGDLAHSRSRERLERPRGGRFLTEPGLAEAVQAKLLSRVEPGADRGMAAHRVPGSADLARVPRDDLPGALRRPGRAEQEAHRQAPHRSTVAQTPSPRPRAHATVHRSRHPDRPPPRRGRGPCPRRRLGRRPDHRSRWALGDRHPGVST